MFTSYSYDTIRQLLTGPFTFHQTNSYAPPVRSHPQRTNLTTGRMYQLKNREACPQPEAYMPF